MNAENFHEYLKNPSMLHQVSYQELKSLMLQYPYSPNLRYLILIKSMFDQHRDYDRNLVMASMASIDRKKLRRLVAQYTVVQELHENFTLNDEFLELKDLSALQDLPAEQPERPAEMAAEPPPSLEKMMADSPEPQELEVDFSNGEDLEGDELDFLDELFEDTESNGEQAESGDSVADGASEDSLGSAGGEEPLALEELLDDIEAEQEEEDLEMEAGIIEEDFSLEEILGEGAGSVEVPDSLEEIPAEADPDDSASPRKASEIPLEIVEEPLDLEELETEPEPPSDGLPPIVEMDDWLARLKPPKKVLVSPLVTEVPPAEKAPQGPKLGPEPPDHAKEVAANSILEDDDIATETLAGILERQGHFDKSIAMYERLGLKYPEKSSFFAAKIKALKNLK